MPSEAELQSELEELRVLRATLEAVRQFVIAVETDVTAVGENAKTVTDLSRQWGEVITEAAIAVGDMKPTAPGARRS
ncbi:hypothetical protein TWF694_008550 [Orbilia ellipsospora]|uniref:DASH complex subunit DAD2 n=1 Tax=Orbilia ellipsospora TaxID=2528407 RepID=A0AAV9XHQ4_9PEZI